MANKEYKFDGMDFDKGLDLSFDMEPKSFSQMSKREVVTESIGGVYDGAKGNLADIDRWKDSFRDKLPKSYKTAWEGFDETTRSLGDLYNQAEKEIKPVLGQISKQLDSFVSDDSTFFKGITSKLKDMFYDAPRRRDASQEELVNTGLQNMLNETFSQMQQQRAEEEAKDEAVDQAHELARDKIDKDRHEQTIKLFTRMDNNISRFLAIKEGVGISIDKKKLELSFRKYMVLGQIHQEQKRLGDLFKNQLEAIRVNTGLPEYKKITASDRFLEKMKSRATDGIYNKMFGESSILTRGLKKIQKDAMDSIRQVGDGLRLGLMGLEGADMIVGDSSMDTLPASIGKIIGGEIGNYAREKAMKPLMKKLGKNKDFTRVGEQLRRYALNPNYALEDLKKSKMWEQAMESGYSYEIEKAFSYMKDVFKTEEGNKNVDTGQGFKGMIQPEVYNRRTAIAQTDVVPGYLARILREVTRFRLKKEDIPLLKFDPITGKFSNDSEIMREIQKVLRKDARSDYSASVAKSSADKILEDNGEDKAHSRKVAELLYELSESAMPLKSGSIQNSDVYRKANKQAKAMFDRLASRIGGETEESFKLVGDIEESLANVRKNATSQGSLIQELLDSGLKENLEELGYIQKDVDGNYTLNRKMTHRLKQKGLLGAYASTDSLSGEERKRRLKQIEDEKKRKENEEGARTILDRFRRGSSDPAVITEGGPSERPSDVELKRGFVGYDAKYALEGVKNIPISSWEYKDQQQHGYGRKIGGMAQDIYKQFGHEAAPNGKKIDLVSMTGINMSAIQGLAKEQEKLTEKLSSAQPVLSSFKNDTSITVLTSINENIMDMHKTLKEKNFALTLPSIDFSQIDVEALVKSGWLGANKLKDNAVNAAKPLIETGNFYVDMVQSLAVKGLNDIYKGAVGVAGQGKKALIASKDFVKDFWENNKDYIKEKRNQFFDASLDLGKKAINFAKETIFETIPNGLKDGWEGLKRVKERLKSVISGPRDIYLRGDTSPVITASRMRHGMYVDSATGQVIYSTDTLLKAQGDIIDIGRNNEVALLKSDLADGVYDQHGNKLETLGTMAKAAVVAGASLLVKKGLDAVRGIKNWWDEPSKIGEMLKGAWGGMMEKLNGFNGISFHDRRQINVLVQIRDLLAIGKRKKLVEHVYGRDINDESFIPGNSYLRMLFGKDHERSKTVSDLPDTPDAASEGTSKDPGVSSKGPGNTTNVEGTLGKILAYFTGNNKTAPAFLSNLPGGKNFVGPLQPNARKGLSSLPVIGDKIEKFKKSSLMDKYRKAKEFTDGVKNGTIFYDPEVKNYVTYDEEGNKVPYFNVEETGPKKPGFFERRKQRKADKAYFDDNFVGPQQLKQSSWSRLKNMFSKDPKEEQAKENIVEKESFTKPGKSFIDEMKEKAKAASVEGERKKTFKEKWLDLKENLKNRYLDGRDNLLNMKDDFLIPVQEKPQSYKDSIMEKLESEIQRSESQKNNRGSLTDRLREKYKNKWLDGKDKFLDAKDMFTLSAKDKAKKAKDMVLKAASDPQEAGKQIVDALKDVAKKIKTVKVPEEVEIGSNLSSPLDMGQMGEMVGPDATKRRGWRGTLANAMTKAKGWGGKAMGALSTVGAMAGGLLGGIGKALGGLIGETSNETSNNDFGSALSKAGNTGSEVKGLGDGIKGLNDRDGDGERDGGSTEMMRRQQEEAKERKAEEAKKAEEAAKRAADSSLKYKSQENAIDRLISGAGGLIKAMGSGLGGLLSLAAASFGSLPGLAKLAWGLTKGAGFLLKAGVKGGWNLGKAVLGGGIRTAATTVARHGLRTGLMMGASKLATVGLATGTVTGTMVAGVATVAKWTAGIVLSPLFAKAALAAGVVYGIYKTYKYFTRNNTDDFEKLRLVQYGFPEEHSDQHRILALENYFLDGRTSPHKGGSFIREQVKVEEILEIMDIKPDDKARVEAFSLWLNERFKPFFLGHVSAIFEANPKVPLKDVKKLNYEELQKYLDKAQNLEGPYNTEESPFSTEEHVVNTKEAIPAMIEKLRVFKKKDTKEKPSNVGAVTNSSVNAAKALEAKKAAEAEALRKKTVASTEAGVDKPTEGKPPASQTQQLQNAASTANLGKKAVPPKDAIPQNEVGDDVGEPRRATGGTFRKPSTSSPGGMAVGNLPVAKGPLARPDDGERFIKLAEGVKINDLNPLVKRYLLAMAAEYGTITGKQILLTDGFRSYEEQAALYKRMPHKAARPGNSMHEFGLAFDVDSKNANELEKLGLMRKYGFTRPIGGEAWHLEMAGHQLNIQKAKKDQKWAAEQAQASLGRGGGGYGAKPGGLLKRRNPEIAKAFWESTSESAVANKPSEEELNKGSNQTLPTETPKAPEKRMVSKVPSLGAGEFANHKPSSAQPRVKPQGTAVAGYTPEFQNKAPKGLENSSPTQEGEPEPSTASTMASGDNSIPKFVPGKKLSVEETKTLIKKAALKAGDDPNKLLLFAAAESSMGQRQSPHAGSAKGPFQFMPETWDEQLSKHGKKYGLNHNNAHVEDPYASGILTSAYLKQSEPGIKSVKQNPDIVDFYLSHMLGPGGVKTFLRLRPNDIPATVMPLAASYNPNVFYKDPKTKKNPRTAAEMRQFNVEKFKKLASDFGIQANFGASEFKPDTTEAKQSESPTNPMVRNPDVNPIKSGNDKGFMKASFQPTENVYTNTTQLADEQAPRRKTSEASIEAPQRKETLTGRPDIASGVTEAITRTATASEALLSTVQTDVVPVLKGIHEILSSMYKEGSASLKADRRAPEKEVPKSSNASTPGRMSSSPSLLNRERNYGV